MTKYNYCPECGTRIKGAHRQGRQFACGLNRPQIYRFKPNNHHFNPTNPQDFTMSATNDRISRFHTDKTLLGLSNHTIARQMRISEPQFEAHLSGLIPITDSFLKKFYGAFGFELGRRWEQQHSQSNTSLIGESGLEDRVATLENAIIQLAKSQQGISMDILRLDVAITRTLEKKQARIERIEKMVSALYDLAQQQNPETLVNLEEEEEKKEKEVDKKLRRNKLPKNIIRKSRKSG